MQNIIITLVLLVTGCAGSVPVPVTHTTADQLTPEVIEVDGSFETLEVREAVIGAMEEVFDTTVTIPQRNKLAETPVYFLTLDEFVAKFPGRGHVGGKATGDGIFVNMKFATIVPFILAHEYIHVLNGVVNNDFQTCHDDSQVFTCEGSVEWLAIVALEGSGKFSAYACGVSTCK